MQDPNTPTQGQAQPASGEGQQGSAPAPEPTPQAPDYASLEQEAQGLGDGISLATLPKQYADARQAMSKAQQEAAELKRQYDNVRPLAEALSADPGLADHVYRQAQAYVTGQAAQPDNYGYEQQPPPAQVPPAVASAFDPTQQALHQTQVQIAELRLRQGLDEVAQKHGMTAEEREVVLNEAVRTDSENVEGVFLSLYGAQRIEKARQEAVKATAQSIQATNDSYVNPGGVSASTPSPPDTSNMTPEEQEAHEMEVIERALGDKQWATNEANKLR